MLQHHIQKEESLAFSQNDSSDKKEKPTTLVSVVAPSLKLLDKMVEAVTVLNTFQVPYSKSIVAAHRAPRKALKFVSDLEINGTDSLYSIVQMPRGVPVGVMGIDSAYNAAIFACQILSLKYPRLKQKLVEHKQLLEKEVAAEDAQLNNNNKKKRKGKFSERYSI